MKHTCPICKKDKDDVGPKLVGKQENLINLVTRNYSLRQ